MTLDPLTPPWAPEIVSTVGGLGTVPCQTAADQLALEFQAPRGLYQFSVLADAREFDWDSLYEILSKFHNVNQRTGPWDFSINHENKPLVPSYWVTINGQRIGLWYFQRVSLEDLAHKRFRGRFAFYHPGGPCRVELAPYKEYRLRWASAILEPDPDDTLLPALPEGLRDPATDLPTARWADPAFWARMRDCLETTHRHYRDALEEAFERILKPPEVHRSLQERLGDHDALNLPLLLAAYHLGGREQALEAAVALVDEHLARPAWGNPDPEGYGHNGDMGAAACLLGLAWAYHALRDHLGEERRARLLARLREQGRKFFDLTLLNRDYWGGSVLQDHGWRSLFAFGAAALHLLGAVPEAELWVQYVIPRLRRSLEAMPRDGAIPPSSYQSPYLYTDYTMHYRDALLALTGEDILDQAPWRPVVDYVWTVLSRDGHTMFASDEVDRVPLLGGSAFFSQMAAKYGDKRAAALALRLAQTRLADFFHPSQRNAYYQGALWGFLSYDPGVQPERAPRPARELAYFEDTGLVHYRSDVEDVVLAVKCGPWAGYHAHRVATGPCDRLSSAPGAGHFSLSVGGVPVLCTPDSGYRLHTALRSCLLIDGRGQYGDIGYPMSLPSYRHRGEQIDCVRWEEATGHGFIRLNLAPAYPEEAALAHYTRDFLLFPERRLLCRDTVVLDEPRVLSWLFQGKHDLGVETEGLVGRFGAGPVVKIRPTAPGPELQASVHPTEVVWAYSSASGFRPFAHVRYDTVSPCAQAVVEFEITW